MAASFDKGGERPFDLARARRETPGCSRVIHFNNAGAALMPQPVVDAQIDHLRLESLLGGYEAAEDARDAIERTYDAIAQLLGCHRDEVAVVENATRAWDQAFYSIPFQPGDRILTGAAEYASNYIAFLQVAKRTGAVVEVVPNDETGQTSVEALRAAIDERVRLIAITHVPTNGGLVNPAARIGRVARETGILYLLDACQSVGQMPTRVDEIGCDLLSATGRKFLRGPRGIGFLYARRGAWPRLEPPMLDLHSATWLSAEEYRVRPDARRFENWETNYAAKIGLGVAVEYALGWGLDRIRDRVYALAEGLRTRLRTVAGVRVTDVGAERCAIVSFTVDGHDSRSAREWLRSQGINVSVSERSSTLLDMEQRGLASVVRASVHYYNTEEEVERIPAALAALSTR